jgi:hypothetical protein
MTKINHAFNAGIPAQRGIEDRTLEILMNTIVETPVTLYRPVKPASTGGRGAGPAGPAVA